MDITERHPRLQMFYESTVLNFCTTLICGALPLLYFDGMAYVSALAVSAAAFAVMILWTLWFWLRRPASVARDGWLDSMSRWLVLYLLLLSARHPDAAGWYLFLTVVSGVTLLVFAIRLLRRRRAAGK